VLGNLDARRDWGYAPDYVDAMWRMLQRDEPEDYVIGTGSHHSVGDLVDIAFGYLGLDPSEYIRQDPAFMRPAEVDLLIADASKAKEDLGWEPTVNFEQLVKVMVDADLALLGEGSPVSTA
jgi:GDPmannose 4,6-dehydratase